MFGSLTTGPFPRAWTYLPKVLLIDGEVQIQTFRIILQDPLEGVVVFWIYRFHVIQQDRLAEHHLIERPDEVTYTHTHTHTHTPITTGNQSIMLVIWLWLQVAYILKLLFL